MFQDFWKNVSRYPTFLVGISLGVILNALAPLAPLMKRPVSAIALISLFVGSFAFLSFTLRAMLGLQ